VFSVDYKENTLGEDWYAADTLITAIGQRDLITPVQLANYVSSIANNGTLYRMTLFDRVMNEDYTKTLIVNEPEVLKTIEGNHGYLSILREGMEAVASSGTAEAVFADYPVKIAAKTGTVESETSRETNAVFVCFARRTIPRSQYAWWLKTAVTVPPSSPLRRRSSTAISAPITPRPSPLKTPCRAERWRSCPKRRQKTMRKSECCSKYKKFAEKWTIFSCKNPYYWV
jgi:membrane peptidoglycan carboxypeptidase